MWGTGRRGRRGISWSSTGDASRALRILVSYGKEVIKGALRVRNVSWEVPGKEVVEKFPGRLLEASVRRLAQRPLDGLRSGFGSGTDSKCEDCERAALVLFHQRNFIECLLCARPRGSGEEGRGRVYTHGVRRTLVS